MKNLSIIIIALFLISCKEDINKEDNIDCSNKTQIEHDNLLISFCLPPYLNEHRKDTMFEGHLPGTTTEYNYFSEKNPITDNGFMKPIQFEDSLFINFCVTIYKEKEIYEMPDSRNEYLISMIKRKEAEAELTILDSSSENSKNFNILSLESIWSKREDYNYNKLYLIKECNYYVAFLYEIRNNNEDNEKYREDAIKLMKSIEIDKIE